MSATWVIENFLASTFKTKQKKKKKPDEIIVYFISPSIYKILVLICNQYRRINEIFSFCFFFAKSGVYFTIPAHLNLDSTFQALNSHVS